MQRVHERAKSEPTLHVLYLDLWVTIYACPSKILILDFIGVTSHCEFYICKRYGLSRHHLLPDSVYFHNEWLKEDFCLV